jgi:hypothetical protein
VRGEGGILAVALAGGVAACLQPLCLFALPAVLLLPRVCARRFEPVSLACLAPLALYAAHLLASDPKGVPAADVLLRLVAGNEGWVRFFGSGPSIGTDVVFLSTSHLKYLANAGFALAPAALPLALAIALRHRSAVFASSELRFVAIGAAGLVAGAGLLRPVFGPFDWELFGVAALWVAFFAGALLARLETAQVRNQVAAAAISLQLCFAGLPLVWIGHGPSVDAGPLHPRRFDVHLLERGKPAPKALRRWL